VEAYVTLVSKIGSPLDEPLYRGVRICEDGSLTTSSDARVESIIDYWLERTDDLVEEFVHGKLTVY
jgi:S-adenosylmethionine synthetase